MAEREGFEPSVRSPPRSLSKGVLSTTQPSLHDSVFGRAFDTQNSCSSSTISGIFLIIFFLAGVGLFPCLIFFVCLNESVTQNLTLAALLVLLASCAKDLKKDEELKKQVKQAKVETTRLVARVQSRPGSKNFILLEAYGKWIFADGVALYSYGDGGRTAALVTSGEKLGQFVAADIKSGSVEIGDAVYHFPQRINEENPQVDDMTVAPATQAEQANTSNQQEGAPVPEMLKPVDGSRGNPSKPALPKW